MKKLLEIFKGDNGQLSSKRFVGIIGAFVLFGTMAHNLGFTSVDKFSGKKNDEE